MDLVLTDAMLEQIADRVMEIQEQDRQNSPVALLERRLADVQRKIKNLTMSLEDCPSQTVKERIMELEDEAFDLKGEIALQNKKPMLPREAVLLWLRRFTTGDTDDENFRQELLRTFVDHVVLYDDHAVIVYNLTGSDEGSSRITEVDILMICSNPNKFIYIGRNGYLSIPICA